MRRNVIFTLFIVNFTLLLVDFTLFLVNFTLLLVDFTMLLVDFTFVLVNSTFLLTYPTTNPPFSVPRMPPTSSATIRPRMANKNIVHVVGTGTIGEPLIAMFC